MFNRWAYFTLPEPRLARQGINLRILVWIVGGLMLGLIIGLAIVLSPVVMCGHIDAIGASHWFQTAGVEFYQRIAPLHFLTWCVYGGPQGSIVP